MMKRSYFYYLPVILFAVIAGFLARGLMLNPHTVPSVQIGRPVPAIHLPNLLNEDPFTEQLFKHQVILLNVFASWCYACDEEHAFLMSLAQQGYTIYGINYKDHRKDAMRWLGARGNPYQAIGFDLKGLAAMDLGVYGAPETFLIDASGVIQYRFVGPLTPEVWKTTLLPKLRELS